MSKKEVFKLSKIELQTCRQLTKKFGTSYYYATLFFPRQIRHATFALYAFFRVPDEIVDTEKISSTNALQKLENFEQSWHQAYNSKSSENPVLSATSKVFHHFQIPFSYSTDFLKAMKQDTEKTTYQNYSELKDYMYGSASVVGLMMTYVIGFKDKKALQFATELGEAMQLTNFLRDIKEDWQDRQRIYLPLNELSQFGLTPEDIMQENFSPNFAEFMDFQITRARQLYKSSEQGIKLLNPAGRFAVSTAATLYSAILTKIEQINNNIFLGRVRTTKIEKLKLILKLCLKRK